MQPISAPAAVWLLLALVSVPSLADICFEGNPRNSFSGRRFHVTGSESDGQVCITVIRTPEDVDDGLDYEEFDYTVSALGNPVFGQGTAVAGVDFLTSSAPIRRVFPDEATSVEVCAVVLADDVACESGEDFQIRITSPNPAFNPICDVERAIVTLQDSTVITAAFAPLPAMFDVPENAGQFNVEVIRFGGVQNTNVAEFMIMEDPATPGCLAGPATVRYQCVAPSGCGDASMVDITKNIARDVTLNLVADDNIIDGTKRCSIILAPFSGSSCIFTFPGGSRQLVVGDNERFLMEFIPFNFYEAMEDEGGVDVTVEVRSLTGIGPLVLEKDVDFSLRLSVDPSNDPAQIGVDLPDQPYSSSVLAGQTSATVRILFTPDQVYEETEIVLATLIPTDDFNVIAPVRPATIQIINDDSVTIVFPDSISVSESDGELVFSLIVLEDHEVDVCLFVLSDASPGDPDSNPTIAKPGEDFAVIRQEVCFKDGSSRSEVVTVPILGSDANVPEDDKTFSVRVELPSEATNEFFNLPDRPGSVMLLDTSDPYMIDFSQAEYRVAESVGLLEVTVSVDRPPAFDVPFTVRASASGTGPQYAFVPVGEQIGGDILGNEWRGFIPSGMTSAELSIDIVEDNLAEYNEEFTLDLVVSSLTPRFAIVGETLNEAQVVILDDDEVTISLDAPSPVREGETTTYNAVFSVKGNFEAPFSIDVMHLDAGTAVASVDYSPLSPKITFTPSDKDQEVAVAVILNDGMSEVDKTFSFKAVKDPSTQLNVVTDSATAVVVIQDNEVLHLFDKVNYVVAEDDDSVNVSVRRRGYLGRSSVVSIVPNSGTGANPAEGSQDFPKLTVVASFSAGEEFKEFEVPITSDMRSELNETFLLQLLEEIQTPPVLVEDLVVEPSQATVTITDFNDFVCVSFSASSYSSTEGDGSAEFTVEADKSFSYEFSVVVTVMPVTATAGDDYTESSFELTFMPGQQSLTRSLSIIDDPVKEEQESVNLVLSVPDGNPRPVCINTPGTAALTIADNDDLSVQFDLEEYSVSEGGTITVNVVASADFSKSFIVDISHDGAGDLSLSSPTLSFSPSSRTASVELTATTDSIKEPEESFTLTLAITDSMTQQFGVQLGTRSTAAVKVQDKSASPECSFDPTSYSVDEGSSVTLMLTCSVTASVDYTLAVESDVAGDEDLTLSSTTVTINAGSTQGSMELAATTDNIKECEESFQLTASLTDSSIALEITIGDGTATVAIADTTEDVAVNFDPASYTVNEGSSVEVFLTADKDYTEAFTVTVSSVNTEDITIQPSTVTFQPPSKRVSVMVEALTDAIQEPTEAATLTFTIGDSCLESVVAGDQDEAKVSITDTSDAVVVCFDESTYSVTEGEQVIIGLSANRDFASAFTMTVTPTDKDGLFSLESIPVTFTPEGRTGSFQFVSTADAVKELDETVSLTLQVDDNGGIDVEICSESATMVTVRDDDDLSVQFELEEYSVSEGGTITVNVVASADFSEPFIVDISHDGAGDLSLSSPTLSFSPSSRTASVELTATTDSIKEPEESFTLTLAITDSMTQQFGVQLGTRSTAAVKVQDTSASPECSFDPTSYSVDEGSSVTLMLTCSVTASVDYTLAVGSDEAGDEDLSLSSTTVTIGAGSTQGSVELTATADNIKECEESFQLTASLTDSSTALGVTIGDGTATVAIADTTEDVAVNFDPASYTVSEGSSVEVFLTADKDYTEAFTVTVSSVNIEDITIQPSTVTFQPPSKRVSVMVEAVTDAIQEPTESVALTFTIGDSCLESVVAGDQDQATVSITDTSDAVVVCFDESTYSVTEGAEVTIGLSADKDFTSSFSVTVTHASSDGDFTLEGIPVTFTPGGTSGSFRFVSTADNVKELDETVYLMLQVDNDGGIDVEICSQSTSMVTIVDDDDLEVSFSPVAYNVMEGGSVTVTLQADTMAQVDYSIDVTLDSAAAADLTLDSSTVEFSAGSTQATVVASGTADNIKECEESFQLTASLTDSSTALGVTIGDGTATVAIADTTEDVAVNFDPASYTVSEGSTVEVFLTADKDYTEAFTVTVSSVNTEDITIQPSTVTFQPPNKRVSVMVEAVTDAIQEPTETVALTFTIGDSCLQSVVAGDQDEATVSITDTSDAVVVCFDESTYSVTEGAEVTIGLSADKDFTSSFSVTVTHADPDGDFTLEGIPVTFTPGGTSGSFRFVATADNVKELDETVSLMLLVDNVGGIDVEICSQSTSMVTIVDDDDLEVSFSPVAYNVMEGGSVTVTLQADTMAQVDYSIDVTLDSAAAADLTLDSSTVEFSAGSTQATVVASGTADNIKECEESFQLTASLTDSSTALGVTIGDGTATVAIADTTEDVAVNFDPASYTVSEGSTVEVFLTADKDYTEAFTVTVSSVNTEDITIQPSTVTFQPPNKRVSVMVEAVTDAIQEPTETVALTFTIGDSCLQSVVAGDQDEATVSITDTSDAVVVCFDESTYSVTEGAEVTIGLSADKDFTSSFSVTVTHADPDGDFTLEGIPVTFTPGGTSGSFRFVSTADNVKELDETVSLMLQVDNVGGIDVEICSQSTSMVTIVDDDDLEVSFSPVAYNVMEGGSVTVTLQADTMAQVDYSIDVTLDSAAAADLTLDSSTVEFSAGSTQATVVASGTADNIKECEESFQLTASLTDSSTALGVTIGEGTATVAIADTTEDVAVNFDPASYTVSEGSTIEVFLTADKDYTEAFTVTVSSVNTEDITIQPSTVTFQPPNKRVSVMVEAVTDAIQEPTESVALTFTIGDSCLESVVAGDQDQATVSITDSSDAVVVCFDESTYSVTEGAEVTIGLSADKDFTSSFSVTVTHAGPDGDFTLEGIPVTFTPGGTSGSFKFVATADNVKELNETVSLLLQVDNDGGIDVEICSQSTSMVTIVDDDDLTVTLSSNQFSVTEGNAATILVTASSEASQPYTVNVVPSAGTATEEDFTSGTYEATFSPGETVALVSIATADGDCAEPLESFTVALQSTSSSDELAVAIGSPSQAEISINDPTVVPVHFEMSSYEVEEGETFSPAIVVEQCYSGSFSVNVLSTDGTATAGSDYTAVNEVEAFTGNERAVLSIDTVEDTLVEVAEVFSVSLVTASVSTGLNVEIDPTSATFTIQEKEPEVSVSFSRDRYSVMEGDSILVQFTVTGSAPAPFTVRVFSEDGTATGGADFTVIDELVDPTTDDITVSALVDDVAESVESFQLSMELPAGVSPGTYAMATVFISDLGTRTVNDTVIADPVYSVPLKIVEGNIPGLSGDLSMCYEIHGKADTWFNLISDTCLSVNAHYSLIASSEDDAGHQIDTIGAVVVSNTNECKEVMVRMVDGKCSFTVNGVGVSSKSFEQDGVMVSKRRNRVRISAPNCENQMVVIWARCEEFASMDMMRLVVNRGFNLSPTSHGLIGQFWNIDASLEKYNDTIVANVYGVEAVKPHYLLHLSPPEPSEKRSMVGELHSNLWDGSEQTCLYVGSSQGGTIEKAIKPIATVIEGTYTDYIAGGPFDRAVKYNRFNSEVCQSP